MFLVKRLKVKIKLKINLT